MNFIKKYNLNKRLNRFAERKKKEDIQACSLKEASRICVFCTFETVELLEELIGQVHLLRKDRETVAIRCFVPDKKNVSTDSCEGVCFISEKDFDFKGSLRKEKLAALREQSFDMLIDLSKATSLFSLYLLTEIEAKFRIGSNKNAKEYYDVVLYSSREDCGFEEYFQSVDEYTKKIIQQ